MNHSQPFRFADLARRLLAAEKVRFLLVGAWNTLFGYLSFVATYLLLRQVLGMAAILAISYAIAMIQSFTTLRTLVFPASDSIWPQLVKFSITNTVVFLANLAFLPQAVAWSGQDPLIVQAVFVATSAVITYYLHKNFSFSR